MNTVNLVINDNAADKKKLIVQENGRFINRQQWVCVCVGGGGGAGFKLYISMY